MGKKNWDSPEQTRCKIGLTSAGVSLMYMYFRKCSEIMFAAWFSYLIKYGSVTSHYIQIPEYLIHLCYSLSFSIKVSVTRITNRIPARFLQDYVMLLKSFWLLRSSRSCFQKCQCKNYCKVNITTESYCSICLNGCALDSVHNLKS